MNSFDARVRYTPMIIEQSFLELLPEKPMSRITVTELCEKAQINRATFYKHYMDIPDLLETIEEDLFQKIRTFFDGNDLELKSFLVNMMHYTRDNQARFLALGGNHGDPNLMTKTFMVCYESAYPIMAKNLISMEEKEKQMLYQFLSHGAGAVLTWWIKDGLRESPEYMAQIILNLCSVTANGMQDPAWRTQYTE